MITRKPGRAFARGSACVLAALLAAFVSGCATDSTTSNASLTTGTTSAGPTIAFESIDGPPPGIFNRLVDDISTEAQSRNLSIASREGAASYRVRGYMAAQVIQGRTHISWVWDVYDDDKLRTLRITGEEAGGRGAGDPWSVADEPMLRRIARSSMDQLSAFLTNPGAVPDIGTAIAAAPEPSAPPKSKRRQRSAAAPTAAERLALTAER